MSAIFGIVDWTGAPVEPPTLDALRRASVAWGADGGGTWTDGGAALGCALRHALPEDVHARLPHVDLERDVVFVGAGRIDNRDALGSALGIAPPERATMADADLMRRAYAAWGAEAPVRLLGDWSCAAWHVRERRLFAARDHCGMTALHYAVAPGRVAFASSLRALLAVPWVDRGLDEDRLAETMIAPRLPRDERSTFRGVRRLLPAHLLESTAHGATTRRYWRMEDVEPVRLGSDAEYVEAMLDAYDAAVRCRLRGVRPNAVTLSGGLDSSSLAALAARATRPDRLAAYTWAPAFAPLRLPEMFADETSRAGATAQHAGNIDVHRVDAADVDPIAAIRDMLACHVVPAIASPNAAWFDETLRAAAARGTGALLLGLGGDATVSWPGQGLLRWPVALRTLGPAGAVRALGGALVPAPVRRLVHQLVRRPASVRPRLAHSPIHPAFAERLHVAERLAATHPTLDTLPAASLPFRLRILDPESCHEGTNMATYGQAHGIDLRVPTLDVRLIQLCLGVPDAVYSGHGRARRWLVREAMRGLLPDAVRLESERGLQGADLLARMRAHAAPIEAALASAERSPAAREYVDVARMRTVWNAARRDDDFVTWRSAAGVLLRGVAYAAFVDAPLGAADGDAATHPPPARHE